MLVRGIQIALQVHVIFIFIQAIWFVSSGNYLDFLINITGEEQRYLSDKGIIFNGLKIPRFTGLFNEPGTYANYIVALTAVLFSIQRKLTATVYLSLASTFLTASSFGYVFVTILIAIIFLSQISFIKYLIVNFLLFPYLEFCLFILRVFESPNILLTFCVGWILYWS